MSGDIKITAVRVTPIAFRDGPLLNAADIHEPWALRAIVEFRRPVRTPPRTPPR